LNRNSVGDEMEVFIYIHPRDSLVDYNLIDYRKHRGKRKD